MVKSVESRGDGKELPACSVTSTEQDGEGLPTSSSRSWYWAIARENSGCCTNGLDWLCGTDLENLEWDEKDLGSSFFVDCLRERRVCSSVNPESSPSLLPELRQFIKTFLLVEGSFSLSKSSVNDLVIFLLRELLKPTECLPLVLTCSSKLSFCIVL